MLRIVRDGVRRVQKQKRDEVQGKKDDVVVQSEDQDEER